MTTKLRYSWRAMLSSFWFVPTMIVLGALALASAMIALEVYGLVDVERSLLLGAGADGSRGLLTALASSMITVAGVVFSITIVALALTSSQYTSRILRNFMNDRVNQAVLGVFVGTFAYCLVVLRSIRGDAEGEAFVPSLAVLGGLVLAFVGIALLIYFIHHISMSIQASNVIARAAAETLVAIDKLFPNELDASAADEAEDTAEDTRAARVWSTISARETGYIENIDGEALLELAERHQATVRMEHGIGEFVIEGTTIASLSPQREPDEELDTALNDVCVVSRMRTVEQDAAFGIRQLVDIALKALSPGINDTTTATMCVDYLTAILVRLANRDIAPLALMHQAERRVIIPGPTFDGLLAASFDQIRQSSERNITVLIRLLHALETIAAAATSPRRRHALREQAELVLPWAQRSSSSERERDTVNAAWAHLSTL